jgi:signal transduction histidine kinase
LNARLAIVFLLAVLLPVALLAWVGAKVVRQSTAEEQRQLEEGLTETYRAELRQTRARLAETIAGIERELLNLLDQPLGDAGEIRDLGRNLRLARQIFVLDATSRFVHPPPQRDLRTDAERGFYSRLESIWQEGEPLFLGGDAYDSSTQSKPQWFSWFWGDGVNFILWRPDPDRARIVGVEVDRMAMLADLVGSLPDSGGNDGSLRQLVDTSGRVIYQWGNAALDGETEAGVELPLAAPLGMWRLRHLADPALAITAGQLGRRASAGIVTALATGAVLVLVLAAYLFQVYRRQMRDAERRVSFVNQVSHELKTPLTNIRMYAELAGERAANLGDESAPLQRHLGIVVDESHRLGRLINNVLAFAKESRGEIHLRKAPAVADDVIGTTLELFRPALEKKGFSVEFTPGAPDIVSLDTDALEQILANLFGNVEKYAAAGKWLGIRSSAAHGITTIAVKDLGPGIPRNQRERVFGAFARLGDHLTEGVSGTGIGLTISRQLARLHGGDLTLEEASGGPGCCFHLSLATPAPETVP